MSGLPLTPPATHTPKLAACIFSTAGSTRIAGSRKFANTRVPMSVNALEQQKQTRLKTINDAHAAEMKSLNELASEGRKRRQEQGEESSTTSSGGESTYQFLPLATSPRQEQQQRQHHAFTFGGGGRRDSSIAESSVTSALNGEGEHDFGGGGGGGGGVEEVAEGGRRATEHQEFGEHHPRYAGYPHQLYQHRDGSLPRGDLQHQHQTQQVGNTPERRRGRGEGGVLTTRFGDAVGGRPRSDGILGSIQSSPPPARTPVDGGDGKDAHWEASKGIGTLRRGKSAGTFFLQQQLEQHQHQHPGRGSGRHEGGGSADDIARTSGAAGERGSKARSTGGRDSPPKEIGRSSVSEPSGRAPNGDSYVTEPRTSAEDQQTVSVLTAATSLVQTSATGTAPPPPSGKQQRYPGEPGGNGGEGRHQRQRTDHEESSRAGGGERSTPPRCVSGQSISAMNAVGVAAGRAAERHASPTVPTSACLLSPKGRDGGSAHEAGHNYRGTTKSAGDMTAATNLATAPAPAPRSAPAPATSMKEMQGRARIQHAPKSMSDVVVTAAGESTTETPQTTPRGGKAGITAAARGSSGKTANPGAQGGGEAADAAAIERAGTGDESDGDGGDKKHQRQQIALRAFLQGVS